MIINGYDTTVGSRFAVKDKIVNTVKFLQSTDRLTKVDKGVYVIDHTNAPDLPPFIFPISFTNYAREKVTVFDQRHYVNKQGRTINLPEYNIVLLGSMLQQDFQNDNMTFIKAQRPFTVKAFANSVSNKLSRLVTLDLSQKIILRVILGHYMVCLAERPEVDFKFVSANVLTRALNVPFNYVQTVLSEVEYVNTLPKLLEAIKNHPDLVPLQNVDIGGFIATASSIFFSTSGFKQLVGGALELPALFTALCWGAATQRIYQNSELGQELNVKNDKRVEAFIRSTEFYMSSDS